MSSATLSNAFVDRFGRLAASHMMTQAQGYTELETPENDKVKISWFSDSPNHFYCEIDVGDGPVTKEIEASEEDLSDRLIEILRTL